MRAINQFVSQRIRAKRKKIGLTQQDMAHLLKLNRVSFVNIESAKQGLTINNLLRLCAIFNCSYSDLLPPITPLKREIKWVEKIIKVPKKIKVRTILF